MPCVRLQLVDVERERQPVAVALEQLREPRLVERDAPGAQRLDLLGHDVPDDDLVAELGEARARDEADPPGPEDAEGRLLRVHARKSTCGAGCRPLAIASIVSFDIESRSVFTTQ